MVFALNPETQNLVSDTLKYKTPKNIMYIIIFHQIFSILTFPSLEKSLVLHCMFYLNSSPSLPFFTTTPMALLSIIKKKFAERAVRMAIQRIRRALVANGVLDPCCKVFIHSF